MVRKLDADISVSQVSSDGLSLYIELTPTNDSGQSNRPFRLYSLIYSESWEAYFEVREDTNIRTQSCDFNSIIQATHV